MDVQHELQRLVHEAELPVLAQLIRAMTQQPGSR